MNVLMVLADGFEEVEALEAHDLFIRTGVIKPMLCSLSSNKKVISSMGLQVESDALLEEIDLNNFDMLYLPGGKVGVDNMLNSILLKKVIEHFVTNNKYVSAICAAPSVLAKLGYLDNEKYTCYPSFECGKGTYLNEPAIRSGYFFTGRAMGHTRDLVKLIVSVLFGNDVFEKTDKNSKGLK